MKFYFTIIILLLGPSAFSQYYYTDIENIHKLNKEYSIIKSGGYHTIRLESFEGDDSPSEGFFCEKKISSDFSTSEMVSKSNVTAESQLKTFYLNGRIVKTINVTPASSDTTIYSYDGKGRISDIHISTFSNMDSMTITENRHYAYNDSGQLASLTREKNGRNVSTVKFQADAKGNIIEEDPVAGNQDRKYYYYYDEENRLTDVVHFNTLAQKLLPDFMFLYDDDGTLKQMITVDESARNYFIWKYAYTSSGLPEIQKCYSKEKKLLGTIQYEYRN
ncbi:MAG: hypothetical protein J0H55_00810 [Chitinophagaceae bacterium]|nr:hypothetical protein [Chitinophagaceae bacterium]